MPRTLAEILDDPADGPVVKAYLQATADKRVTTAIQTYATNHPSDETLAPRLVALEAAADAKIAAMKLETYVLRACHKSGLNPDDVEDLGMTFKDEADVDAKLGKLGVKVKARDIAEVNLQLINSFKPGAGVDNYGAPPRGGPGEIAVDRFRASLSPEDRAALANRR